MHYIYYFRKLGLIVLIPVLIILIVVSCTPDVEYGSADFEHIGLPSANNVSVLEAQQGQIKIPIFYGGKLENSRDISVQISVDPSSTAVYGKDYTIVGASSKDNVSVTIPSGKTTDTLRIVLIDNFNEEANRVLKFSLAGSSENISVAGYPRPNKFTINITDDDCEFDFNDYLGVFSANEPGYGDYDVEFTVDPDVNNRIISNNFWDYGGTPYYNFIQVGVNPNNYEVIIPEQIVTMGGDDYTVSGTGQVLTCDQSFYVDYVVKDADGEIIDENRHTFTK